MSTSCPEAFVKFTQATLLYESGKFDQALETFKISLEADKGFIQAKISIAQTLVKLGHIDEAIEGFEFILEPHSNCENDPFLITTEFAEFLSNEGYNSRALEILHTQHFLSIRAVNLSKFRISILDENPEKCLSMLSHLPKEEASILYNSAKADPNLNFKLQWMGITKP